MRTHLAGLADWSRDRIAQRSRPDSVEGFLHEEVLPGFGASAQGIGTTSGTGSRR